MGWASGGLLAQPDNPELLVGYYWDTCGTRAAIALRIIQPQKKECA